MVRVKNRYILLGHVLPTFMAQTADRMLTISTWVLYRYIILLLRTKDGRINETLGKDVFAKDGSSTPLAAST